MPRPSPPRPCRRAYPCSPPFTVLRNAHPRYAVSIRRAPPAGPAWVSDLNRLRKLQASAFGTPGGMPMAFVRCYTGTDGQSHFEDLDLPPPDMERSIAQTASSITFTRSPNGRFSDWHNAPRRQYTIFLSGGQMEVVIGDGATRRFGPGDAVLFEDLTGQGHTSRSVGGDRLTAIVPLAD